MAKLRGDHVMLAREMQARDVSVRQIASQVGVDESTLWYRLSRAPEAPDRRQARASVRDGWADVVPEVLRRLEDARIPSVARRRVRP